MSPELAGLRDTERWIAWVRLAAVPFAAVEVGVLTEDFPDGYETWAWAATAALAVGAVVLFFLSRSPIFERAPRRIGFAALAFDTVVLSAFVLIYQFDIASPVRQVFYVLLVEAAVRYGVRGGLIMPAALVPVLALDEWWREAKFDAPPRDYRLEDVVSPWALLTLTGLIVGWLVDRLRHETAAAREQVIEAERLRDELGRRADVLDAATRCPRAQLVARGGRGVPGLHPRAARAGAIDRMAIVLEERGAPAGDRGRGTGRRRGFQARLAAAGRHNPARRGRPNGPAADVLNRARDQPLGLRSRIAAPLLQGMRTIGMISLVRREPRSFSHEIVGSAQTLQQRWRELAPSQRESFLGLIASETARLAALVGDVLDTSRIEAGTFSYRFADVDVGELVRDTVANIALAQDEVPVATDVDARLPRIRGDGDRLKQVLTNLIDNAVKYSPAGEDVVVSAYRQDSVIRVEVSDRGPGVPRGQQRLIFEKFGRAGTPGSPGKPGTGLGLFIARSIAEAHGGSLDVRSETEDATFTMTLPVDRTSAR